MAERLWFVKNSGVKNFPGITRTQLILPRCASLLVSLWVDRDNSANSCLSSTCRGKYFDQRTKYPPPWPRSHKKKGLNSCFGDFFTLFTP